MAQTTQIETNRDPRLTWLLVEGRTPFLRVSSVLASRHKLSILWELARGPKRFKELERSLAPVTAKVLTRNLRDLQGMALILRHAFDESPPKVIYEMSEVGATLRPHILALCHWAYENAAELSNHGENAVD